MRGEDDGALRMRKIFFLVSNGKMPRKRMKMKFRILKLLKRYRLTFMRGHLLLNHVP